MEIDTVNFLRIRDAVNASEKTRYLLLLNWYGLAAARGRAISELMDQAVT